MRIIGIDPGMAIAGYSVIDIDNSGREQIINVITSGSIQTSKDLPESERLLEIFQDLCELTEKYKPDVASVEKLFYFKNAKTIMPVAQARGVILLALAKFKVPIHEYTPLVIKQTITGYGRASKEQVREMTCLCLQGCVIPKLDDAVDAIAIALCHLRHCDCICA